MPADSAAPPLTPIAAEVHLGRLRRNARVLQERAGTADLLAVVKADAFGHGAVPVAQALRQEGIEHFAVARVPEAIALREAGLEEPILLFEAPLPHHLPAYIQYDLEASVSSAAVAEAVVQVARTHGPLRVHLNVDTGMNRLGVAPQEAPAVAERLAEAPGVTLAGTWTHLATAGAAVGTPGDAFAAIQLTRFQETLSRFEVAPGRVHAANSTALLTRPDSLRPFGPTFARVGIALYGLAGSAALAAEAGLRPVMRLRSRVVHLHTVQAGETVSYGRTWAAQRPTRLATVAAGYGDGYARLLSGRGEVGLRGRLYPVAGAVCMDLLVVDLGPPEGPAAAIERGDEAVLFGTGGPSAFEVARRAETIPYEVCCSVSRRVPRCYVDTVPEASQNL